METEASIEFLDIMTSLDRLVADDYINHQKEIISYCKKLNANDIGVRYFIEQSLISPDRRNLTGAQSFFLYGCRSFGARINMWFPRDERVDEVNQEGLRQHFSYHSCHNHNYDFFTVGVLGAGYETDFFTTSQDISNLKEDDLVNPDYKWKARVGKNDAMFVPKDTHFHTQFEPKEFSMTINVVPIHEIDTNQYILHTESNRVHRIISPALL